LLSPADPVVVLTGAPCSGKSTAAAGFAPESPDDGGPMAVVDLDAIRYQVRGGFKNPMATMPPADEALAQWQLAIDICCDMTRRYRASGYAVVIDAPGIYPDGSVPWEAYTVGAWKRALGDVDWRLVVLQPDVELVCSRAVDRRGVRQPPAPVLRSIHAAMQAWAEHANVAVIDTTTMTVDEVVTAAVAAVRRS
jgi:hypothetical protein